MQQYRMDRKNRRLELLHNNNKGEYNEIGKRNFKSDSIFKKLQGI